MIKRNNHREKFLCKKKSYKKIAKYLKYYLFYLLSIKKNLTEMIYYSQNTLDLLT